MRASAGTESHLIPDQHGVLGVGGGMKSLSAASTPVAAVAELHFEAVTIRVIEVYSSALPVDKVDEAHFPLSAETTGSGDGSWCLTASADQKSNPIISYHSGTDSDPTSKANYVCLTSSTVQIRQ